mmetsp:Transcript_9672/g.12596  ORF Transcript_9672/g.12596 Transcript_9672/m.12596 type:complete len:351 (+) Transcript_9672:81-1133(+)
MSLKETYGRCMRFFVIALGVVGIACTVNSALTCRFINYEIASNRFPDFDFLPGFISEEGSIGLFWYHNGNSCVRYRDMSNNDEFIWVARYGVVAAGGAAFFGVFFAILESLCVRMGCCGPCLLGTLFFMASLGQAMTFTAFGTENMCIKKSIDCSLSIGSILSIVACPLYMFLSIMVWFMPTIEPCYQSRKKERLEDEIMEEGEKEGEKAIVAAATTDTEKEIENNVVGSDEYHELQEGESTEEPIEDERYLDTEEPASESKEDTEEPPENDVPVGEEATELKKEEKEATAREESIQPKEEKEADEEKQAIAAELIGGGGSTKDTKEAVGIENDVTLLFEDEDELVVFQK